MKYLILLQLLLFAISCSSPSNEKQSNYAAPEQLNDGWQVANADSAGMDATLLAEAAAKIESDYNNIDGIVVVKNGKLVLDEYFNDYGPDKLHKVWSVTKSVTNALVGIAIQEGYIHSVNDSIHQYLGAYTEGKNPALRNITIEHLLTMTSGIEWVELGGPQSAGYRMAYADDWVTFVLNQPVSSAAGTQYNYSTGNTVLFAPILKNATGMQADAFAKQHLFAPLGITNYDWMKPSEFWTKTEGGELPSAKKPEQPIAYSKSFAEYPNMGSGLKMLPRDMAKIGQLYLDKGVWNSRQIIDSAWIVTSIQPHFGNEAYGYYWRLAEYDVNGERVDCFYATGFGQQAVYVFPALDLVVVFTQQNYRNMQEGEQHTQDILQNYILKAAEAGA